MGLFDIFKPKWKHRDPLVRLKAVKELSDTKILKYLSENDLSKSVRKAAYHKLHKNVAQKPINIEDVFSASVRGDYSVVIEALNNGLDPNVVDQGNPLLHMPLVGIMVAEREGTIDEEGRFIDILSTLLESGADTEIRDKRGWTTLHAACEIKDKRGEQAINTLIENGADVNAKDNKGWTPIHYLANHGKAKLLLQILQNSTDINAQSKDGNTPLHLAVNNGHSEAIKVLLDNGADSNIFSHEGVVALHIAVLKDNISLINLLLNEGADTNLKFKTAEEGTALHIAASRGKIRIVEKLLQSGADKSLKDSSGNTAYDISKMFNQTAISKLLR